MNDAIHQISRSREAAALLSGWRDGMGVSLWIFGGMVEIRGPPCYRFCPELL